jgi:hypothetical protein
MLQEQQDMRECKFLRRSAGLGFPWEGGCLRVEHRGGRREECMYRPLMDAQVFIDLGSKADKPFPY